MIKAFFFIVSIVIINCSYAQVNPRPTSSRFLNNNRVSFQLNTGDLLIYEVNNNGVIDSVTANVIQTSNGLSILFNKSPFKGVPHSMLLDKRNYDLLARGRQITISHLDSASRRYEPSGTITQKIVFKGREAIFTTYKAVSKNNVSANTLLVLTDRKNPLITKVSSSIDITLKEVR